MPAFMRGVSRLVSAILARSRRKRWCRRSTPTCRRTSAHWKFGPWRENFHARYAAHAKTYRYYILNARVDDPFTFDTCCRIGPELDVAAMQAAAERFVGTHDFRRCVRQAPAWPPMVTQCGPLPAALWSGQGNRVTITVTADGYLYNMVRILAGTLVEAGLHKRTPESIPALLASRDRRRAGQTLPAKGLFLEDVAYPELTKS